MSRKLILSLILLLSIITCGQQGSSDSVINSKDDAQLSDFIIGEWYSEQEVNDINGAYLKEYQIEFIDDNMLEFSMKSLYDGFKDKFSYHFITNNTLSVENERSKGGEWEINKDGENLLICIWSNQNCQVFIRINTK